MNIFTTVVFMSLFWILFSQLNELRSANNGCCGDKSCGSSEWDRTMWGINLTVAILLTLFFLYKVVEYYEGSSLEARDFKLNPTRSIAKQARLLFGK